MDEQIKKIGTSKRIQNVLWVVGGVALALGIFQAGVFVGFTKARFSLGAGDRYYHSIFGPEQSHMGIPGPEFPGGHGALGKIIRIDQTGLVIADQSNIEKIVTIDKNTVIKQDHNIVSASSLSENESVIVFGVPDQDDNSIKALFIRILPNQIPTPAITQPTTSDTQPNTPVQN